MAHVQPCTPPLGGCRLLGPCLSFVPPTAAAQRASGSIHAGHCWEALRLLWQPSSSERTPRCVLYACDVQKLLA